MMFEYHTGRCWWGWWKRGAEDLPPLINLIPTIGRSPVEDKS